MLFQRNVFMAGSGTTLGKKIREKSSEMGFSPAVKLVFHSVFCAFWTEAACQKVVGPSVSNFIHHSALMITYHEECNLKFGFGRTNHCQFWLEANLYGVRVVTHRGLQGLTAFWPSVCPLGRSIIHVGVMHLSQRFCIVSSTKRSGDGWMANTV